MLNGDDLLQPTEGVLEDVYSRCLRLDQAVMSYVLGAAADPNVKLSEIPD